MQTRQGTRKFKDTRIFTVLQILGRAWLFFKKDNCLIRASGLSFTSFLALVPFAALVFSIFSLVGMLEGAKSALTEYLSSVVVMPKQEAVFSLITQFIDNTNTLGFIGLLTFLFVSIFLINNIVKNVNAIWYIHYNGKFISRFTLYTSILLFIPIILGVTLSLASSIQPLLSGLDLGDSALLSRGGLFLLSEAVIFITLFLLYMFMPYATVPLSRALLGALFGTIFWEIARRIFYFIMSSIVQMSLIYGSLTAIPIFLVWLYISWGVVLYGVEITYVFQHGIFSWSGARSLEEPPVHDLLSGLHIFFYIARKYRQGENPPDTGTIIRTFYTGGSGITYLLTLFEQHGVIREDEEKQGGYIPARPLDRTTIAELLRVLMGTPEDYRKQLTETALHNILSHFIEAGTGRYEEVTVEDVLGKTVDQGV